MLVSHYQDLTGSLPAAYKDESTELTLMTDPDQVGISKFRAPWILQLDVESVSSCVLSIIPDLHCFGSLVLMKRDDSK
jgi:hypothetical protein